MAAVVLAAAAAILTVLTPLFHRSRCRWYQKLARVDAVHAEECGREMPRGRMSQNVTKSDNPRGIEVVPTASDALFHVSG